MSSRSEFKPMTARQLLIVRYLSHGANAGSVSNVNVLLSVVTNVRKK